ncbi:MAG: DUF167 domain-containing protein [Lentisphaeria bacterium]|jgi:hypothetical protein
MPDVSPFCAHARGTVVRLHVQPRARRTEVAGRHGDALKLRVASPPVDGAANAEVCRFLAQALGLPKAAVTLLAGETGRGKRILVAGLPPDAVARKLLPGAAASR